jgi:hypothetical protein
VDKAHEEDWREHQRRREDEQREKERLAKQAIEDARIRRQQVAAHCLLTDITLSVHLHTMESSGHE